MKEIAITDVRYWTSNIHNIKTNPPTDLNAISEVTRVQMGGSYTESENLF